jgi:hypothetical protein
MDNDPLQPQPAAAPATVCPTYPAVGDGFPALIEFFQLCVRSVLGEVAGGGARRGEARGASS